MEFILNLITRILEQSVLLQYIVWNILSLISKGSLKTYFFLFRFFGDSDNIALDQEYYSLGYLQQQKRHEC